MNSLKTGVLVNPFVYVRIRNFLVHYAFEENFTSASPITTPAREQLLYNNFPHKICRNQHRTGSNKRNSLPALYEGSHKPVVSVFDGDFIRNKSTKLEKQLGTRNLFGRYPQLRRYNPAKNNPSRGLKSSTQIRFVLKVVAPGLRPDNEKPWKKLSPK